MDVVSCQAGMQDLDQVRDNNPLSFFLQGQECPIHSCTFLWGKSINCPFHSPISDNTCNHPPVQTFGAVVSGRDLHHLSEHWVRKVSNNKCSKVSLSGCICLLVGANKGPNWILGSLARALYNLADMGRSLTKLQKVHQVYFEAFLAPFLYLRWTFLYRVPSFVYARHLLKSRLTSLLRHLNPHIHFAENVFAIVTGLRRQLTS